MALILMTTEKQSAGRYGRRFFCCSQPLYYVQLSVAVWMAPASPWMAADAPAFASFRAVASAFRPAEMSLAYWPEYPSWVSFEMSSATACSSVVSDCSSS